VNQPKAKLPRNQSPARRQRCSLRCGGLGCTQPRRSASCSACAEHFPRRARIMIESRNKHMREKPADLPVNSSALSRIDVGTIEPKRLNEQNARPPAIVGEITDRIE
jgi:hypothetical protein